MRGKVMSTSAFVLVEMAPGKVRDALRILKGNPNIKVATAVAGAYDIVVTLEADNHNAISKIITDEVHELEGLVKTTTLIAFEIE